MRLIFARPFYFIFNLSILLFVLFAPMVSVAQQTAVSGVVKDVHNKPIPFVVVSFNSHADGVSTDQEGHYRLMTTEAVNQISFTFIGYKKLIRAIKPGEEQIVNVKLDENSRVLHELVIRSKKTSKYRNKNNPAVELIRKVIEHKALNRPESYSYIQFSEYERLKFSVDHISEKLLNSKMFKRYQFLVDKTDSSEGGKSIPIFMEEKLSSNFYRKTPEKKVQIISKMKTVHFDKYLDQKGLSMYLNRLYGDIDIYSNNIFIVTNQFLSPIADAAPTFYQFFITDTVQTADNKKLVELSFIPRNKSDLLFQGKLYVSLDGNYSVQKASLGIGKDLNLNWVRSLLITQDFKENGDGRYHVSKSQMRVNFGVLKKSGPSIIGERIYSVSDYAINIPGPDSVYLGHPVQTLANAESTGDKDIAASRPDTLRGADAKVYSNIDSLKNMPSFKRTAGVLSVIASGFLPLGPVEIGAIGDFYSHNPIEGDRFRFGGRTTPLFDKSIYFQSYGAYGFHDQQWKYFIGGTYAFNHKSIYTFPLHYVQVSYQYDTQIPGESLQYGNGDNLLFSFKRGINDKYVYSNTFRIDYIHEYLNHFSYTLGLRSWKQLPTGSLYFVADADNVPEQINSLSTTELSVNFRYAPHEQIFQGKLARTTIPSRYPILSLTFTSGVKGLLGGEYSYQNVNASIFKRFYLSQLGFTDISLNGTYILGQTPFPLLTIHHANQSFSYQQNSYNLMNFLEFVSDHSLAINVEHHFNGFILNKIPIIRELKFKEIIGVKLLYGGLRDQNNPALHPGLFQFPVTSSGIPLTYSFNKEPYIEGNIGIGNIFKVLRIDLVKRFDYLYHPDVTKLGIRFSGNFDF